VRRRRLLQLLAATTDVLLPTAAYAQRGRVPDDSGPVGPSYMTRAMVPRLTFDVMHTTAGPRDNVEDSIEYPLTAALSPSIKLRDTTWDGDKGVFVWDNRADGGLNTRPNGLRDNLGTIRNSNGHECRTRFSSIPRARASVEARIACHLGYPESTIDAIVARAGFNPARDRLHLDDIVANNKVDLVFDVATESKGSRSRGQDQVVYACSVDKVILPNWRLRDARGSGGRRIALDYESHDGRTGEAAIGHLRRLKDLTSHSPMGNVPLHAVSGTLANPRQSASGLTIESLPSIHGIVDVWYLAVTGGGQSAREQIEGQLRLLRGPGGNEPIDYARLAVWFQFGTRRGTSIEDAKEVHDIIVSRKMYGIGCWDNGAKWGGSRDRLTVQKQHMVFFGRLPNP
jgi:hypothetical protein